MCARNIQQVGAGNNIKNLSNDLEDLKLMMQWQ